MLWESKIELSEDFFNEIINHPVPLDMNTLTAQAVAHWASISTCGSPTAPSRSVLRYVSPGGRCTGSSACTRQSQRQAHRPRLPPQGFARVEEDQLAWPGLNYTTAPGRP